ncbi:MAG: cell division protein ZipA C-terminal FtsZ-binding domain-containing protein [Gammaproteobacteria bacterium]
MTALRWILLIAALLILLAVFLWSRYHARLVEWARLVRRRQQPAVAAPAPASRQEPTLPASSSSQPDPVEMPEKIVTIRILCRGATPFPGEQLILALRAAGLRHGRFGIFHMYPPDNDSMPVFSVASLTEPGSFDLSQLRTDVYQGVSLFLGLPGPVESITAFDAMVETARTIARELDGNLVDEHGSTMSIQRERYLREEVIQFQHRQSRPG